MKKQIQEAVTFIKATQEEAITLANDIVGDAEVHALVVQKGFTANPEPVGYMVVPKEAPVGWFAYEQKMRLWFETNQGEDDSVPLYTTPPKREWVGLTKEEIKEISFANRPYVVDMVVALEAKLKEKNG